MYKFCINSAILAAIVSIASNVIGKKNSMPILDSVLISKDGDNFTITGSNTENELTRVVPTMEVMDGEFFPVCLPAKNLSDVLKNLPEQMIYITVTDKYEVTISYDNGEFQFTAYNSAEYPRKRGIDSEVESVAVNVDAKQFLDSLNDAMTCTDNSEIRPVMNCVCMDISNEGYTLASSDGHKLYKESIEPGAPFIKKGNPAQVNIPKTAIKAIVSAFDKAENIDIEASANVVHISSEDTSMLVTLVEGAFPNYNAAIPTDTQFKAVINKNALRAAIKRVLPFASMSSQLLRLSAEKDGIRLKSEDLDFATSANELVPCETDAPEGFQIGVRGDFLQELLGLIASDEVTFHFTDASRAIVIREEPRTPLLLLIMPLLLND